MPSDHEDKLQPHQETDDKDRGPKSPDQAKSTKHKESFVRWQAITIAQFGYAINLLLGFAVALLAFAFTEIKDSTQNPSSCEKIAFDLSLLLLLASAVSGTACVINRLRDFRKTTHIARDREQWQRDGVGGREIDDRLDDRRCAVKMLGNITWVLFYLEAGTFLAGVIVFMIVLAITNRTKLF